MIRIARCAGLRLAPLALLAALAACGDRRPPERQADKPADGEAPAAAATPAAEAAALDQGPRALETVAVVPALAATGQVLFDAKGCTGCHEMGSAENAPDLRGVATRRTEAWLRRQIADPEWMAEHDPITREMVTHYGVPMADLDLSADEVMALLQFMVREDASR